MKAFLIVIGLVVVIGGGFFLYDNFTNTNNLLQETNESQENSQNNVGGQMSQPSSSPSSGKTTNITDLASRGAVKCDLDIVLASQQMTDYRGVFYSDGSGKYRMELWPINNPSAKNYTLVSKSAVLIWSSNSNKGFRMDPMVADPSTIINASASSYPYNYSCASWRVDASILQPPAGVTFSEMPQVTNPYAR